MKIFKNIKERISELFSGIEKNKNELSVSEQIEQVDAVLETAKQSIENMQGELSEHPEYDHSRNEIEYDLSEEDDWFDL